MKWLRRIFRALRAHPILGFGGGSLILLSLQNGLGWVSDFQTIHPFLNWVDAQLVAALGPDWGNRLMSTAWLRLASLAIGSWLLWRVGIKAEHGRARDDAYVASLINAANAQPIAYIQAFVEWRKLEFARDKLSDLRAGIERYDAAISGLSTRSRMEVSDTFSMYYKDSTWPLNENMSRLMDILEIDGKPPTLRPFSAQLEAAPGGHVDRSIFDPSVNTQLLEDMRLNLSTARSFLSRLDDLTNARIEALRIRYSTGKTP